jgi:hypothetical protein
MEEIWLTKSAPARNRRLLHTWAIIECDHRFLHRVILVEVFPAT